MIKQFFIKYWAAAIALGIGGVAGAFFVYRLDGNRCQEEFPFLNSDLACAERQVVSKREYAAFKETLAKFFSEEEAKGRIQFAAVYFRDLVNGPTFGINEKEPFIPASLLKIPVLLAYLEEAEENPELLSKKLVFRVVEEHPEAQFLKPREVVDENVPYAVSELLERMIKYSDNRAYEALVEYLGRGKIIEVYYKLGIVTKFNNDATTVTAKNYASIFRALFNSSYLSREMSNKALELFSQTDFKGGLTRGVPSDIKVAHKFGEQGPGAAGPQLHDCGIVYSPGNPYLVCVLVRGYDYGVLQDFIGEVSAMIYREFDSRRM